MDQVVFEEFEEGDPRRGPHSPEVLAGAAADAERAGRWHGRNVEVDWLAIRLTIGRGYNVMETSRLFGVGEARIYKRNGKEKWSALMLEEHRREMSVRVWLAGVKRLPPGDEERREALKAASEWRLRVRDRTDPWPEDWRKTAITHAPGTPESEDEIPDDIYYSEQDTLRDERIALRDQLHSIIAGIEHKRDSAVEGGPGEAGNCAPSSEIAGDAGDVQVAGASDEGMGVLAQSGPDAA